MIRSHLLDAFLAQAWYLHGTVYDRLADLLEAHVLGHKAELRARTLVPLDFLGDGSNDAPDNPPPDECSNDTITPEGIAVINVRGVLAMHADQVNGDCQPQGRSYDQIRAQITDACADPNVRAIALRLETPGGSAAGCQEVYDAILASGKPVGAYCDAYCFSAGYYLASACQHIAASSIGASIGSIGTVMSLWDTSKVAEKAGYRKVVIRSGPYKALAQDGEPLTDAVQAELQRECNAYAAQFYDAVRLGRGLTTAQAEQVLNGRCFLAVEAQSCGLIDAVQSWADFLATLAACPAPHQPSTSPAPNPSQGSAMFNNKKSDTKPDASPAPAPAPAPAAAGLTKADYAALAARFPEALADLAKLDAENKSAEAITIALLEGRLERLHASVDKHQADLKAAAQAHHDEITAKNAQIADLTAQVEKAKAWTGKMRDSTDPGSDASVTAPTSPLSETSLRQTWESDAKLREGFGGDFGNLLALAKAAPKDARRALGLN